MSLKTEEETLPASDRRKKKSGHHRHHHHKRKEHRLEEENETRNQHVSHRSSSLESRGTFERPLLADQVEQEDGMHASLIVTDILGGFLASKLEVIEEERKTLSRHSRYSASDEREDGISRKRKDRTCSYNVLGDSEHNLLDGSDCDVGNVQSDTKGSNNLNLWYHSEHLFSCSSDGRSVRNADQDNWTKRERRRVFSKEGKNTRSKYLRKSEIDAAYHLSAVNESEAKNSKDTSKGRLKRSKKNRHRKDAAESEFQSSVKLACTDYAVQLSELLGPPDFQAEQFGDGGGHCKRDAKQICQRTSNSLNLDLEQNEGIDCEESVEENTWIGRYNKTKKFRERQLHSKLNDANHYSSKDSRKQRFKTAVKHPEHLDLHDDLSYSCDRKRTRSDSSGDGVGDWQTSDEWHSEESATVHESYNFTEKSAFVRQHSNEKRHRKEKSVATNALPGTDKSLDNKNRSKHKHSKHSHHKSKHRHKSKKHKSTKSNIIDKSAVLPEKLQDADEIDDEADGFIPMPVRTETNDDVTELLLNRTKPTDKAQSDVGRLDPDAVAACAKSKAVPSHIIKTYRDGVVVSRLLKRVKMKLGPLKLAETQHRLPATLPRLPVITIKSKCLRTGKKLVDDGSFSSVVIQDVEDPGSKCSEGMVIGSDALGDMGIEVIGSDAVGDMGIKVIASEAVGDVDVRDPEKEKTDTSISVCHPEMMENLNLENGTRNESKSDDLTSELDNEQLLSKDLFLDPCRLVQEDEQVRNPLLLPATHSELQLVVLPEEPKRFADAEITNTVSHTCSTSKDDLTTSCTVHLANLVAQGHTPLTNTANSEQCYENLNESHLVEDLSALKDFGQKMPSAVQGNAESCDCDSELQRQKHSVEEGPDAAAQNSPVMPLSSCMESGRFEAIQTDDTKTSDESVCSQPECDKDALFKTFIESKITSRQPEAVDRDVSVSIEADVELTGSDEDGCVRSVDESRENLVNLDGCVEVLNTVEVDTKESRHDCGQACFEKRDDAGLMFRELYTKHYIREGCSNDPVVLTESSDKHGADDGSFAPSVVQVEMMDRDPHGHLSDDGEVRNLCHEPDLNIFKDVAELENDKEAGRELFHRLPENEGFLNKGVSETEFWSMKKAAKKLAKHMGLKISQWSTTFISSGERYENDPKKRNREEGELTDSSVDSSSGPEDSDFVVPANPVDDLETSGTLTDSTDEVVQNIAKQKIKKQKRHKRKHKKHKKHKRCHSKGSPNDEVDLQRSQSRSRSRSRSKSRSRSRSMSRSRCRSFSVSRKFDEARGVWREKKQTHLRARVVKRRRLRLNIDKDKLREIAIQNSLRNLQQCDRTVAKSRETPGCRPGGKSMAELTDFCKTISGGVDFVSSDSGDDCGTNVNQNATNDEEDANAFIGAFMRGHDKDARIVLNIRDSKQLPALTAQQMIAKKAVMRLMFPVSNGAQHRKEEGWVPVTKPNPKDVPEQTTSKINAIPTVTVPIIPPTPAAVAAVELAVARAPPVESFLPTSALSTDISVLIADRLAVIKRLQENPTPQALQDVQLAQMQMQQWTEEKQIPGQFFASVVQSGLIGNRLKRHDWLRKENLNTENSFVPPSSNVYASHCGSAVLDTSCETYNIGKLMMLRMGWKEGEGLGRQNMGRRTPLSLDKKNDRKGLQAAEEVIRPPSQVLSVNGKHPVSFLMELCTKNRMGVPDFVLAEETGPSHSRCFLYKVTVNGVEYQPTVGSRSKKTARMEAALCCLSAIGFI